MTKYVILSAPGKTMIGTGGFGRAENRAWTEVAHGTVIGRKQICGSDAAAEVLATRHARRFYGPEATLWNGVGREIGPQAIYNCTIQMSKGRFTNLRFMILEE